MPALSPATLILVIAVGAFTALAAFWDFKSKRIPNKLTLPMFFAGWVYQLGMSMAYGWDHLASAGAGFAVGFGLLFVLWFVGGGGGGDVKLMGALSVWLGFQLTLGVLFISTLCVMLATMAVVLSTIIHKGMRGARQQYLATGKVKAGQKVAAESQDSKVGRRVMAYAGPVAVATWIVVLWNLTWIEKQLHAQPPAVPARIVQPAGEGQ